MIQKIEIPQLGQKEILNDIPVLVTTGEQALIIDVAEKLNEIIDHINEKQ